MAEGNETPGNEPPEGGDVDFLAARRARRGDAREPASREPALVRRAEAAEATVRTLETHMTSLQGRLREVEEEQRRSSEQLLEREQEVRRVKQREYAEQQLRVEAEETRARLGREHRAEVDRLNRRLAVGERHARELADQLETARRELAEAEQAAAAEQVALRRTQQELVVREADSGQRERALDRTRAEVEQRLGEARAFERQAQELLSRAEADRAQLTTRLADLEQRAVELQQGLERERAARERSEQELARTQAGYARLEQIVGELRRTAVHLRDAVERDQRARIAVVEPTPVASESLLADEEALRRAEMAEALAAAVERLRARVAAVGELDNPVESTTVSPEPAPEPPTSEPALPTSEVEPAQPTSEVEPALPTNEVEPGQPEPDPEQPVSFTPRVIENAGPPSAWLAPAIRRVAQRRDAKLAGELITELLLAQCLVVDKDLTYRVRITELGLFEVRLRDGRASVQRLEQGQSDPAESVDLMLEGAAADFSELAAGGTGRRFSGLRIRGSRRRARRLLKARRPALALSDLIRGNVDVWPGLLLLALAEAIDPAWTVGADFVLAFAVGDSPQVQTTLYVRVRDGQPLVVTRVRGDLPQSVIHLSEGAFLRMVAGAPLEPQEPVLLEGDAEPLKRLLVWVDRAQGHTSSS
jgi:hypothetical protein